MIFFDILGSIISMIASIFSLFLDFFLKTFAPFIDYVATHYRPIAMILIVLPLSFCLRIFLSVRDYVYITFVADATAKGHDFRVARVVSHVTQRLARPKSERRNLCTARAPWQNLSTRFADYKKKSDCIYVGDFRNMLHISEDATTVTLEPLVTVGMATSWLLPKGFMLATTLEIEEATIGGLACAVGMTTASHKYGLLQETVEEYEIVLGDGALVRARRDNEYSDLWHAFPWSHGSLGLLVGLTLKIIPVTNYGNQN
jgi:Delta24-sterol reductase